MKKKTKDKGIKRQVIHTEDESEMKRFIIILVIVIVVILVVYFITKAFVSTDDESSDTEITAGEINYDVASIGTMFNRSEDSYYVILYDESSDNAMAVYYDVLVSNYMSGDEYLHVYTVDMSNELNKSYVAESEDEINVNTTDLSKFKTGDITLLKIKDGKIKKALTTKEDIEEELTPVYDD